MGVSIDFFTLINASQIMCLVFMWSNLSNWVGKVLILRIMANRYQNQQINRLDNPPIALKDGHSCAWSNFYENILIFTKIFPADRLNIWGPRSSKQWLSLPYSRLKLMWGFGPVTGRQSFQSLSSSHALVYLNILWGPSCVLPERDNDATEFLVS